MKLRKQTRKPPEPRVVLYARITLAAEKQRRRLLRMLGDCTNGELVEHAFHLVERECLDGASDKRPETSAAA